MAKGQEIDYKCHNRSVAREQKVKKEIEKIKQRRRYVHHVDKTEKQTKLNTGKTVKGIKQGEGRKLR
jgi:hypothetical protein